MYKVCILTAGKGTRNAYTQKTHKALLPLGNKVTIDYIFDRIPQNIEVVIATGHLWGGIEFWAGMYQSKSGRFSPVKFVRVRYEGENVGPGSSLLECAPYLQCPFIFTACDTIVLERYPKPDRNWIGIAPVIKSEPYLTVAIDNYKVTKVYDKIKDSPSMLASIGVVGVKDYKDFWEGLSKPRLVEGEHQITDGLSALIPKGLRPIYFTWFDTGTTEGYEIANKYFSEEVK